jgi:hypothetical protein
VKVGGLAVDGLLAPLKAGGKEPGDGEHAPPETSGHQEEVEKHSNDRTPPVSIALLQDSLGRLKAMLINVFLLALSKCS